MSKKILLIIVPVFIFVIGFLVFEFAGDVEGFVFDQIPYNHTGSAWVPPKSSDQGSLAGYYRIWGEGRDFNFFLVLPGAEQAEDPMCYTKEGLNGTGKIDKIDVTFNTLTALLSNDFKKAMFGTRFSGDLNMNCAAWNGTATFSNDGRNFPGTFKINGAHTYWEGTFQMVPESNRIAVYADYIYYPQGQSGKIKRVKKTYYL